jgi:hypothetical protein
MALVVLDAMAANLQVPRTLNYYDIPRAAARGAYSPLDGEDAIHEADYERGVQYDAFFNEGERLDPLTDEPHDAGWWFALSSLLTSTLPHARAEDRWITYGMVLHSLLPAVAEVEGERQADAMLSRVMIDALAGRLKEPASGRSGANRSGRSGGVVAVRPNPVDAPRVRKAPEPVVDVGGPNVVAEIVAWLRKNRVSFKRRVWCAAVVARAVNAEWVQQGDVLLSGTDVIELALSDVDRFVAGGSVDVGDTLRSLEALGRQWKRNDLTERANALQVLDAVWDLVAS